MERPTSLTRERLTSTNLAQYQGDRVKMGKNTTIFRQNDTQCGKTWPFLLLLDHTTTRFKRSTKVDEFGMSNVNMATLPSSLEKMKTMKKA